MSISSPIQPPAQNPPAQPLTSEGTAKAILESGDAALKQSDHRQIIKGDVIKAERDGTVTVNTDTGEIRVRLPENTPNPPRPGDKVEIQIPPNTPEDPPVREVTIRVIERAPPEIKTETPPPRTSETPVQVILEPLAPLVPVETLPLPEYKSLEPGQPIRLQPLPPALYPDIVVPTPEIIVSVKITEAAFKATQIIQAKIETIEDIPLRPVIVTNTSIQLEFPDVTEIITTSPAVQILRPIFAPLTNPAPPTLPSSQKGEEFNTMSLPLLGGGQGGGAQGQPQDNGPDIKTSILPAQQLGTSAVFVPQQDQPTAPPVFQPLALEKTTLLPLVPMPQAIATTLSLQVEAVNPAPTLIIKPSNTEEKPLTITPETILIPDAKPQTVIAKVSGFVKETLPVVSLNLTQTHTTGIQNAVTPLYILHAPVSTVEAGTELVLTTGTAPQTMQTLSLHTPLPPYPAMLLTPEGWPVLDQIYQGLALAAPLTARSFINVTPNPGNPAQMSTAALFFIAAVRSGDLQGWLGDKALESLKQAGKSGLLSRLTQEGGLLLRLAKEPVSQDWKGVPLPMAWQNEIQKTVIYYRHEDEDKSGEEKGGKGTRFVMDLNLTRIGKVQLDGFFRDKRFDLILRTTEPFSASARHVMRGLFTSALESENLSGELGFQNKPENWVKITGGTEVYSAEA